MKGLNQRWNWSFKAKFKKHLQKKRNIYSEGYFWVWGKKLEKDTHISMNLQHTVPQQWHNMDIMWLERLDMKLDNLKTVNKSLES